MSTSLGWRAVESEVIPIEENAKNEEASADIEQAAQRGIRRTRTILRVVAVIRLLIAIAVTVSILYWDKTKGYCMSGGSGGYGNQGAQLEAIEKRLNEEASDNGAASELFRFHRALFINAFNILSVSILWAGAFMEEKTFLPICAIIEVIFSVCVLLSLPAFRSPSVLWYWIVNAERHKIDICISAFVLFLHLVYCGLFIRKVLLLYYNHLNSRDQARDKAIYGENTDKNVQKTQFILRCFAVARLLISIAITFLILNWHNVHMNCWRYNSDGGFLSPARPMESIQRRLDYIAENRIEAPRIYRFHRAIALDVFNIAVVALLWVGAFERKKKFLPTYAILEIVLLGVCAFDRISEPLLFLPMLIILLAYCAVFLPMVLLRYYKQLDSRDLARKNAFNGDEIATMVNQGSKPSAPNMELLISE